MSEKISNLKISDNKISLHYDGQDISYRISVVPHEMWVACISPMAIVLKNNGFRCYAGEIKVNDKLLCWDFDKNMLSETEVKNVYNTEKEVYNICIGKGRNLNLLCSGEHPFFVIDKGWVNAKNLTNQDIVFSVNENELKLLNYKNRKRVGFLGHHHSEDAKNRIIQGQKNKSLLYMASQLYRDKVSQGVKKAHQNRPELIQEAILNGTIGSRATAAIRSKKLRDGYASGRIKKRFGKENVFSRPEVIIKIREKMQTSPNNLEKQFISFFERYSLPIEYTGNGIFPIISDKVLFPDFHVTGQDKLIEVGNKYWHSSKDFAIKINLFKKVGFESLCLYDSSLKNEKFLLDILQNFIHNGIHIISVKKLTVKPRRKLVNFYCEPHNNFFVNKMLVHNSWDYNNPIIFFHKNLRRQYRTPMAIHEAIEKYVCERYGLNEHNEGHRIAEYIEEEWFIKRFGKKKLYDYNHEYDKIQRNEWFSFLKKHKFKHEKGHVFKEA